jgi:hypothetical protein
MMLSWPLGSGCELERRKSSGENQIINDGYLCNHRICKLNHAVWIFHVDLEGKKLAG